MVTIFLHGAQKYDNTVSQNSGFVMIRNHMSFTGCFVT